MLSPDYLMLKKKQKVSFIFLYLIKKIIIFIETIHKNLKHQLKNKYLSINQQTSKTALLVTINNATQ